MLSATLVAAVATVVATQEFRPASTTSTSARAVPAAPSPLGSAVGYNAGGEGQSAPTTAAVQPPPAVATGTTADTSDSPPTTAAEPPAPAPATSPAPRPDPPAAAAPRVAGSSAQLGYFSGDGTCASTQALNAKTGLRATVVTTYTTQSSWSTIANVAGLAGGSHSCQVSLGLPMVPTGSSLADVPANLGTFRNVAQQLVASGYGSIVIRLGWEFNGDWFPWSARSNPAGFVAAWRSIHDTMMAIPGAAFLWDWCASVDIGWDIAQAYPGDAYVDYVGDDVYDEDWAYMPGNEPTQSGLTWSHLVSSPYDGLNAEAAFAAAHGKRLSIPEWGVDIRSDGHGLGDDPTFIDNMAAWFAGHDVAYADYFWYDASDGLHALDDGHFPMALAAFEAAL
jgi:hypothetical protein